jgi:hypothetical protein
MKIVKENLFEVNRDEDRWANQEIAKHQGKYIETPYEIAHDTEKDRLIDFINYLEEFLWENGNRQQIANWEDYMNSVKNKNLKLIDLSEDQLEEIFLEIKSIVNELERGFNI